MSDTDSLSTDINLASLFTCPVCDIKNSYPMAIIKCGHTVCNECIEKLDYCPICRKNFTKWMIVPNLALIGEKTKKPEEKTDLPDFGQIMQTRFTRQQAAASEYVKNTTNEIIEMFKKSIKGDDPAKTAFTYTIREAEPFYSQLMNQVAHSVQNKLAIHRIEVKADHTYNRATNGKREYSYDVTIILPP